ncbi:MULTISPECIES: hypothetical protein [unclassified Nocardia]|uniref:hypothetical protein n=1 Tax=unclassified Nocardia TaxID=2637762 RepID=UPI001CE3D3E4|nr:MULTISPECIES: hypothetical protein [unclassified Nocardia]
MATALTIFSVATAIVLVVVAILAAALARAGSTRRQALERWAAETGWRYAPRSDAEWVARLPRKSVRGLRSTLTGVLDGFPVTVADYSYTTSANPADPEDDSTRLTHQCVVVAITLDRPHPPITVTVRDQHTELAHTGHPPVETGNPLFDNSFQITSADPEHARQLVGQPLVQAHLAGIVPHWSITGDTLLTYFPGSLGDPAAIPTLAAPLLTVAKLLER